MVIENPNLIQLWVLTGRLLIHPSQSLVTDEMDIICKKFRYIATSNFSYVHENTTNTTILRKFVV